MQSKKTECTFQAPFRQALLIILISLLLAACAGAPPRPEPPLQWPPAPLPAQIEWVKSIGNYRDAGITKGYWGRLVDFVMGESDLGIGKPYGIYVDDRGRLFIVDTAFCVVHVFDGKEKMYTVIGQGEHPIFLNPIGITGDDNGNVYITDSKAAVVYRFSFLTNHLVPFVTSLKRPTGIAFNRTTRLLYVSDTTSHQVVVFDLNGRERLRIGSAGDALGQFNHPTDLFIDRSGTLYVTDPLNARIQLFSPSGAFLRAFGKGGDAVGEFSKPKGVAVDGDGNIYSCDALTDVVQIFNGSGAIQLAFGGSGSARGEFWMPSGIHIDKDDTIYVADTYNRRVQVFRHVRPAAPPAEKR